MMNQGKLLMLIGTRPEAIKTLPLLKRLKGCPEFQVKLGVTGQHRELLEQTLKPFDISIDWDLGLMRPNQTLSEVSARCLGSIPRILEDYSPDLVLVQGDTTTATMAALSSFFKKFQWDISKQAFAQGTDTHRFPKK